ncbi:metal ABC transporter permease [Alicyclobacillus cycloheptanicus]|uniref:Zinc/manganese transport system permease protein n=1 Tax=Alicyclobacillus cycloheptanicus TaxID=1457 RepID=A0ABT9XKZ6_9BACL|nr:metal ABC transporter permease [Alicyclobacillus cycloheptanicus]MDQ0190714.1 zinc/manganese transport system permease protein [Alicyclobacillus cycloheptanicus]WDL99887.1 metal ABC transporter permease [Alicyclobacillus cycloheptanicus]
MFQYEFMQNALLAGSAIACMCGVVGVFVIARKVGLLAHVFSDIGFSGGAFAVYMGWNPLTGLLLFTTLASLAIGGLGAKVYRRDTAISVVLSISLGLGLLFLSLSTKLATAMFSLLFGSIVGVSSTQVWLLLGLSAAVLLLVVAGCRVLAFDSFDPAGAEAAGLPTKAISVVFILLMSVAVGEAMQVVGALLVFTLMTIPAAIARNVTRSIAGMMVCSAVVSVLGVWFGLTLSFYTNIPVSFYIAATEGVLYFASLALQGVRQRIQFRATTSSIPERSSAS